MRRSASRMPGVAGRGPALKIPQVWRNAVASAKGCVGALMADGLKATMRA
jgi:hypothetical protein